MKVLVEELDGGYWVAAIDNKNQLLGLEVDPAFEEVRWGAIYWAKVARIDKKLDAAFVNLDGDNIGILHNADVRVRNNDGSVTKGGDVEIGKLLTPGQMIAVQAKTAFFAEEDMVHAKAGSKSPKLSMDIVLYGRYIIYTPFQKDNHLSRRIRGKALRKSLESMLDDLKQEQGVILRAAASGVQTDVLVRESKLLRIMWEQMEAFLAGEEPQLIMEGPDAVQRTLSDQASQNIESIEITTMDHFEHVEEWCDLYGPDLMPKITPIEDPSVSVEFGLFDLRDILPAIKNLFQPYAMLELGASIIIQETAALTAIDVNSGSDTRSNLSINHDVTAEIARQIRLRNLGGILMIDFLKMKSKKDKEAVREALQGYFDIDPCTVQIHGWTAMGLLEITRHRRTPSLYDRFEINHVDEL